MNRLEAVDRNSICYRSNYLEEGMRLISAFERNRIGSYIEEEYVEPKPEEPSPN
jgi:hypothetical protein